MVRKFLYFFTALVVLVIAGGFALNIYQDELTEIAFVPTAEYKPQEALKTNIYDDPAMWFSGPVKSADNPTRFKPTGAPVDETDGPAAVFFVHPTSFISRDSWNMQLGDLETDTRTRIFLRGLASPFASAGQIWAPKYRQATVGAFLTEKPEGKEALDGAYRDVLLAFDSFLESQQDDRPIILAGHSQGARHLLYLLQQRVAGKPLAKRIVAAYIIGWPISVEHDLPQTGLPLCTQPNDTGCIITYQSFSEPADYGRVLKAYGVLTGLDGQSRADSQIACTNPLTGGINEPAGMEANLGTLKPNEDMTAGELVEKAVPARCDENGFLLIGDPPKIGNYVFPGGNYHVYDIPLFWANLRFDSLWRLREYLKK
ncbi:DUF3089 domain-containing protein [Sphingorhabdus arenilitoris]|uniref:DUF3089 domain-containing protein n=1 Tax=Sphingorhabdus arenilitoris TaxID=1490041 RepID=A0ABV8REY0_9SPHN